MEMQNMENNQETPVTDVTPPELPPTQYLLMVNEISMLMMSKMFNGLQFLKVEGMPIKENPGVMVMVTPIAQENAVTNTANPSLEVPPSA